MKKASKPTKKREYFILEEWLPALQKLDGFSLLAIEFKKNTTGFVKQVKGQVFEEYEKYIGNIKVVEKHPVTVVWRHTGACYNNRHARMEQFDVTQYLEQ